MVMRSRTPTSRCCCVALLLLLSSALQARTVTAFTPSITTTATSKIQRAAAILVETSAAQSPAFRTKGQYGGALLLNNKKAAATTTVLDATAVESESITTNSSVVNVDSMGDISSSINGDIQSSVSSSLTTTTLGTPTNTPSNARYAGTIELAEMDAKLLREMEEQASYIVDEMMDETCEVDESTGTALDELCVDEEKRNGFRATLKGYVQSIESLIVGRKSISSDDADAAEAVPAKRKQLTGDELEKGCEWYLYSRVPKRADDSIVVS